MAIHSDIESS